MHDTSYVGEDAWDDDSSEENVQKIINHNERLNAEDNMVLKEDQGISGEPLNAPIPTSLIYK